MQIAANYIEGAWLLPQSPHADVYNPATGEVFGQAPLSGGEEVDRAAEAASKAFQHWRRTPVGERIQYLFKLKHLLERDIEEISRTITSECGKTLGESRAEMHRAIENVETACGTPMLMQGDYTEDVAPGIDEMMIRRPLGVAAIICPFNFPGMIPFWFLPYALACGNSVVVKPSEKVPFTMQRIFSLLEETGLPAGVVNLVNGSRETADALLDHPAVRSVSFVGSSAAARHVYARAAANGKRVQCQGGAKNPIVVLPDADMEMTSQIAADSAFGCAGQRCLAASLAVTVGDARNSFRDAIAEAAKLRWVGNGLDEAVQMGPVISQESRRRIDALIGKSEGEGARVLVDGRNPVIAGYENGFFVRPTILDAVPAGGETVRTEIFGPVLGLLHAETIDEAIDLVNSGAYGNMACLFTSSGSAARKFKVEAEVGNVGINIGVAAPLAWFPFSGARESFFGDLHGQGRDAIQFFTQEKVVVERWPREWSRKF